MSESQLLVPMNVEALVVPAGGSKDSEWVDLRPDFRQIGKNRFLGSDLEADPEVNLKTNLHKPGIHLHWALPDGLTAGKAAGAGLEFPCVPDRWLIVRCREGGGDGKAWVLESDRVDEQGKSMWPRLPPDGARGDREYHVLAGRAFDLGTWTENTSAPRIGDITAIGYGDPGFAAYYPACGGMFGFHDAEVQHFADARLTYFVAGWYADPTKDPLHRAKNDPANGKDWLARFLEEKRWTCDAGGQPVPEGLLCHGVVSGVFWAGGDAVYDSAVPAGGDFAIAAGNTFAEAFAALFDDDGLKELVEALQYDLLDDFEQPDGDEIVERKVHEKTFSPLSRGRRWNLARKIADRPWSPPGQQPPPVPGGIRILLARLNERQRDIGRLERERESLRSELYATWYKGVVEAREAGADIEALRRKRADLQEGIAQAGKRIDALKMEETAQRYHLAGQLARFLPDHELQEASESRFWRPNDPVLLFTGQAFQRSLRHGEDGRYRADGTLFCRLGGQIVTTMTVSVANRIRDVTFAPADIDSWCGLLSGAARRDGVPAISAGLLREALLLTLDSDRARKIATAAYQKNGISLANLPSARVDDLTAFILSGLAAIWRKQKAVRKTEPEPQARHDDDKPGQAGTAIAFDGKFPSPLAMKRWKGNPWVPLHLYWRVGWHATPALPAAGELEKWLVDGVFPYPETSADAETFCGTTLLTAGAAQHLASRLRHYQRTGDTQGLSKLIAAVDSLNLLGQSLGGLNEQFLSRKSRLELMPLEPGTDGQGPHRFTADAPDFDAIDRLAPLTDSGFFPFRAGRLELKSLWIIDAFGQVLKLEERNRDALRHPILRKPPPLALSALGGMPLEPRLPQAARLAVEWLPAGGSARENAGGLSESADDHPVCGWVLPNLLDAGLMIYDASGNALGALQSVRKVSWEQGFGGRHKEIESFHWMDLPGSQDFFFGKPPASLAKANPLGRSADPDLQGFVNGLLEQTSGAAFGNLLDQMDSRLSSLDATGHGQNSNLALLIGRPFALARARIHLELYGVPARDQRRISATASASGGIESCRFPIKLEGGGLVGFFLEGDYRRFYPAFDMPSALPAGDDADALRRPPTLSVAEPLEVTFLMDPSHAFFATTGILPKKSVRLPYDDIAEALEHKEVIFFTGPLVSPADAIRMPQPSDLYGQWSWNHHPQVRVWSKDQPIADCQQASSGFSHPPLQISEGWLKLTTAPLDIRQLRIQGIEPVGGEEERGGAKPRRFNVQADASVVLTWTVAGAEAIELRDDRGTIFRSRHHPLPAQYCLSLARNTTLTVSATDRERRSAEKTIEIVVGPPTA